MKTDRIIGILSILLQKDKMTVSELAEKFEVSKRTISRDIESINNAGIPIVTMRGQGGGISIMENFKLDRTLLSNEDMLSIITGLNGLDSVSDSNRYRILMDKLNADSSNTLYTDNNIIIDLSAWEKSAVSGKIELIKTAIEDRKIISFDYFSPEENTSRRIEPYNLIFQWSNWYVRGYCTMRSDYRMFKLTRMTNLKTTEDEFLRRDIPKYVCDKLRHTKGSKEIKVRFDKSVKWRIIDEFGSELPDFDEEGNSFLSFYWSDINAFYIYIMTYGDKAKIISPKENIDEFLAFLKKIKNNYQI